MNTVFTIASAQYEVSALDSFTTYEKKISDWVEEAVRHNAELLVFPEYCSMELASLLSNDEQLAPDYGINALQSYLAPYLSLFGSLALEHNVYICAGSYIVQEDNKAINRSFCFNADGSYQHQDKLIMTRFEREQWIIKPGCEQYIWELPWGRVGVMICYDSEFPMIARRLVEKGAEVLLCPSCTDTEHGYFRVRTGCAARALENQCIVVQSVTVGDCPWSAIIDENRGAAGVFAPMDQGFTSDGVVAMGTMNTPQWVYATIDLSKVARVRSDGAVANYRDWQLQF